MMNSNNNFTNKENENTQSYEQDRSNNNNSEMSSEKIDANELVNKNIYESELESLKKSNSEKNVFDDLELLNSIMQMAQEQAATLKKEIEDLKEAQIQVQKNVKELMEQEAQATEENELNQENESFFEEEEKKSNTEEESSEHFTEENNNYYRVPLEWSPTFVPMQRYNPPKKTEPVSFEETMNKSRMNASSFLYSPLRTVSLNENTRKSSSSSSSSTQKMNNEEQFYSQERQRQLLQQTVTQSPLFIKMSQSIATPRREFLYPNKSNSKNNNINNNYNYIP